jgi:hypothetical protein
MFDDATAVPRAEHVLLDCVCATVWLTTGPVVLHPTGVEKDVRVLRDAAADGCTIWLQLALADLGDDAQAIFEGALDPWSPVPLPIVDWTSLHPVLAAIGLPRPAPADTDTARDRKLLFMLPYLYGRGVARVSWEVWGASTPPADVRLLLTVGFEPEFDALPRFWALRANIAVIRNIAVSVRLPDLLCSGSRAENASTYRPPGRYDLPDRFYPAGPTIHAEDVADAIALHQAATARVVSERVRSDLRDVERRWAPEATSVGAHEPKRAIAERQRVTNVIEVVYQLDRQISRLLRRFGSHGNGDGVLPTEVKLRYQFALDELRSLQTDGRLASDAVESAIATREREDHERFQFIAAVLGAAILIPTLVASVYGANVALPAEESSNAFIGLLLFIGAFAGAGLLIISEAWQRRWAPGAGWFRSAAFRIAMAVFALAAFSGGVLEVMSA